ncbi:maltodextrin glucosidase [Pseudaeromonas paramecii]|uniref:Maltodextrin glucosidase n=1 Tax=Pseudaeromonas paramecii TaxID=2138166 RepID=A0ABP8QFA4_9GAMM
MSSEPTLQAWHLPVPPLVQQTAQGPRIQLWLKAAVLPQQVVLRCEPDNEEWQVSMAPQETVAGWQAYAAWLPLNPAEAQQRYCFKLLWPDDHCWFGPEGLSRLPLERLRQFTLAIPSPHPAWVADQLFYQVYVDRFAPGDGPHLIQDGEYVHQAKGKPVRRLPWDAPLTAQDASCQFYGGDLDGLTSKLDYLQQLGVTALYLNPIFCSPSVHKYDTQDYFRVDAHLGGNPALVRLRQATRARGMRLILDGVFNHTGDTCPWFDRYGQTEQGAAWHSDSPYRDWYHFVNGQAQCWKGNPGLVKLDYASPGVMETLYAGRDSVVRHWLREPYAIDGWRLDVAHMLGEGGTARGNLHHLAGIYRAARQENPQAYLLGEHFGDAREWLQQGVEDGAMNYSGFALPVRAFLAGVDVAYQPIRLDAAQCAAWLEHYRAGLSQPQQLCLFNQLDSHDTRRFLTLLGGDLARMELALCWLYGWIGVPCLFYGTEIGLSGDNDPFNRPPFPWQAPDSWQSGLLSLCRQLGQWRRQSQALRRGGCAILYAAGESLVFVRQWGEEAWLFALQRSGEAQIRLTMPPGLTGPWQLRWGTGVLQGAQDDCLLALSGTGASLWQLSAGE